MTLTRVSKILPVLLFATMLICISCKKDRTCDCTIHSYYYYSGATVQDSKATYTYKKLDKQHANEMCGSSLLTSGSGSTTVYTRTECTLE